ncbi:NUDIX hydrolase [Bosea sp. NPDC055332]
MDTAAAHPIEYACALPIKEGLLLLGLRSPHRRNRPSCWDTVGGHVEPGETAEAALVRELQEEIGITPTGFRHFETIETTETDGITPALWHLFTVSQWTGRAPEITNDEHSEIRWFCFDEAQSLTPLASEAYRPAFARLAEAFGPGW